MLSSNGGKALVELCPKTGRTHQLRVHLASLGTPICGDDLYGAASNEIDRQALHAISLEFSLPSGERIKLRAPFPKDMSALCEKAHIKIPEKE